MLQGSLRCLDVPRMCFIRREMGLLMAYWGTHNTTVRSDATMSIIKLAPAGTCGVGSELGRAADALFCCGSTSTTTLKGTNRHHLVAMIMALL